MLDVTRTVRFCLSDAPPDPAAPVAAAAPDAPDAPPRSNTFSAWPPPAGLPRYYELHVTCTGTPAEPSGYLINIKTIDDAARTAALPILRHALATHRDAAVPLGSLLQTLFTTLAAALPAPLTALTLQLTPYVTLTAATPLTSTPRPQPPPSRALSSRPGYPAPAATPTEPAARHPEPEPMPTTVLLEQQYEFSAAHRLHVPTLTAEQNRATFGKCNNPAGHGHNYRLAVAIACPIDPATGHVPAVAALDDLVHATVLEPLDHKHLNLDVPAFAENTGVNPSVEHIAAVIWQMLAPAVPRLAPGVTLDHLRLWETPKTSCTYRGPRPA